MKYRKKPVEIEAVFYSGQNWSEIVAFCPPLTDRDGELYIHTLEGDMHVSVGDWVIRGVEGEFYPCKANIFDATYEEVK